jgi:hypothetical protein
MVKTTNQYIELVFMGVINQKTSRLGGTTERMVTTGDHQSYPTARLSTTLSPSEAMAGVAGCSSPNKYANSNAY